LINQDDNLNDSKIDGLEVLESKYVLAPSDNYRGMSYTELIIRWTRWLMGSISDYQQGNVVFLRGNIGHHLEPNSYYLGPRIEMEQDTAILVPVITTFFRIGDFDGVVIKDEDILKNVLHEHIEAAGPIWATVKINSFEGQSTKKLVKSLEDFKFESTTFWLAVSNNNPFLRMMDVHVVPGSNTAMAGGYFVLLKDLPQSQYFIRFGGKGFGNFFTDALSEVRVNSRIPKPSKDISGKLKSPDRLSNKL
jgi:hypothetical protein